MLSYRHNFHAGNHADILKHSTLMLLLETMVQKDKPFTVLDTHGGGGIYNLDNPGLLHTGEAEKGILTFLDTVQYAELPSTLENYVRLCSHYRQKNLYPGSPEIIRSMMREKDKLFVAELHSTEIEVLRDNLSAQPLLCYQKGQLLQNKDFTPSVTIHYGNGFEMLKARVPPQIKRGIILMDPSYETDSDYREPVTTLTSAYKKWPSAIIALWYPLLVHRKEILHTMKAKLIENILSLNTTHSDKPILTASLLVHGPEQDTPRLYGSEMLIVNAPYMLEEKLKITLPYVQTILSPLKGNWHIKKYL